MIPLTFFNAVFRFYRYLQVRNLSSKIIILMYCLTYRNKIYQDFKNGPNNSTQGFKMSTKPWFQMKVCQNVPAKVLFYK